MKKIYYLSILMLVVMALPFMVSCSKDDDGGSNGGSGGGNITVVVYENGTTSNGSVFSAIDDMNFYLDYIKYTVEDGHLVVTGYDKVGAKGVADIVSRITYKGHTYDVLKVGSSAFYNDTDLNYMGLTSVTIPNSVTSIGYEAFYGCSGLTSIDIPNSVTSIERYAFSRCTGLTSMTIPNSVKKIGYGAFQRCDLSSIKVESGNNNYDSRDNCNAIIETATNTLIRGCKNTIIPNSVTSIGKEAFYGCYSLTSIDIPNSVTSISYGAFQRCMSLISVTIHNSVTSIGDYAFQGCTSLREIHCQSATPPSLESHSFEFTPILYYSATLYVPVGSIDAYKNSYWSYFLTKIEEE